MRSKAVDMVGKTINNFKVIDIEKRGRRSFLLVVCPYCGKKIWKRSDVIKEGKIKSCGCYNTTHNKFKAKDIKDRRFGRLVAIAPTDKRDRNNGSIIWTGQCSCGNTVEVSASLLEKGVVRSCGCLANENSKRNGKLVAKKTLEHCIEDTNINNLTSKTAKNNTSGVKGVSWDKSRNRWIAQIVFQKKHYYFIWEDMQKKKRLLRLEKRQKKIFLVIFWNGTKKSIKINKTISIRLSNKIIEFFCNNGKVCEKCTPHK